MFGGMDKDAVPKKQPEVLQECLTLTQRDTPRLERRKRKDEPLREAQCLFHLAEMEAAKQEMPVVSVNHDDNVKGPAVKDIHMENFSVSFGGRELIQDGSVTLSFGRHYGNLNFHYVPCRLC
ncbi:hypothetical protein MKW94_015012 [Papaver nudicaule]|uniref:Uncharacterized protein n=1 Tax=Papaver nudicaule TaxID=74823 RepID=A0AA41VZJ5_PAPNU|nr:hypothetical protein [Papaver nudicaule]MCL7050282.1 hypothetical protein [Papaver nudicaule]